MSAMGQKLRLESKGDLIRIQSLDQPVGPQRRMVEREYRIFAEAEDLPSSPPLIAEPPVASARVRDVKAKA